MECPHLDYIYIYIYMVGGFNPSEKYARQLGLWHSQYMESHKIHVPNHQPIYIYIDVYNGFYWWDSK